jgi:hypothetical protein
MSVSNLWRVFCDTDDRWETSWVLDGDPAPTACPVNPAHTIAASKTHQTPEFRVLPTTTIPCPPDESAETDTSFQAVGALYYEFARYSARTVRRWRGLVDVGTKPTELRVVRLSDGAVLGSISHSTQELATLTVDLTANLPAADDTLVLQFRHTGGGGPTTPSVIRSGSFQLGD